MPCVEFYASVDTLRHIVPNEQNKENPMKKLLLIVLTVTSMVFAIHPVSCRELPYRTESGAEINNKLHYADDCWNSGVEWYIFESGRITYINTYRSIKVVWLYAWGDYAVQLTGDMNTQMYTKSILPGKFSDFATNMRKKFQDSQS